MIVARFNMGPWHLQRRILPDDFAPDCIRVAACPPPPMDANPNDPISFYKIEGRYRNLTHLMDRPIEEGVSEYLWTGWAEAKV